jgi:hypothetical protein
MFTLVRFIEEDDGVGSPSMDSKSRAESLK